MTVEETRNGAVEASVERRIPCEVYSRIVGYLRPIRNWNKGKQQEFGERRTFNVPETPKS